MTKKSKKPSRSDRPEETLVQLKKELRRRGMSEPEVEATVRKKRRRKILEMSLVHSRHLRPHQVDSIPRKAKASTVKPTPRESRIPVSEELCTVAFAARRLGLHNKTVLRFIRDGRLRATRIGKSYRIRRSDLEAFAGAPVPAEKPAEEARVTSIVDVPGVGPELAQRWSTTVLSALHSNVGRAGGLHAEVVYEAERSHLKIVVRGTPGDTAKLMVLIQVWLEQLAPAPT